MRPEAILLVLLAGALGVQLGARAVEPTADELAAARQWHAARFGDEYRPLTPGLEVTANHGPISKGNRFGKPLRVGEVEFTQGLFCHAPSRVVVRLPGPGGSFRAVAGVDVNEHTSGGQGSVVFAVEAGGQERYRSGVKRGTEPGETVDVALDGATEFTLIVEDAGDGIACDQADWADGVVTLGDGTELRLDDLPVAQSPVLFEPGTPPYSFVYGGRDSREFLGGWRTTRTAEALDEGRVRHTITHRDPETGLELRCETVEYLGFPTVEWTLYFRNTGTADTPLIENIQALDVGMERGDLGEYTLHHFVGSQCRADDYSPVTSTLGAGSVRRLGGAGGRPSNSDMPYLNIESTCRDGVIVVVGWPGQWAAEFRRDDAKGLRVTAGQELTRFKLLPGEEVRTPLMVLQFWEGDWIRAQNVWRRWMMAHGMPKPGGELPRPQLLASSSRAYEEMIKADADKQKMFIDRFFEEGIRLDYWWMDAGWYVQQHGWPQVGTWEVDKARFPRGLREVSDYAHAKGVKILVWFEPERVAAGTWLTEHHPEWILGGAGGGLLNLGNPEAWNWLVEHIDGLIRSEGIDLYRQDFNMDPLAHWRGNDAEDRQGITEIKHVTGYLAFWDELLRRHPGMLIDSCASGGRRNDLETMRRSVPLWRSDYAYEPIGHQGMTYGISFWLPFHGTGTVGCVDAGYYGGGWTPVESYAFWSNTAPSTVLGMDMRVRDIDYPALRGLVEQWRSVAEMYYGDFYPLTGYSLERADWMGWQFDRPERGDGMVQVFRRDKSIYITGELVLRGLDPAATYTVADLESGEETTYGGAQLLERGLVVTMEERPMAKVFVYRRTDGGRAAAR